MRFSSRAHSVTLGVTPAHEWSTITAGTRPLPAGNDRSPVIVPGCSTISGLVGSVLVKIGKLPVRPSASVTTPPDVAQPASTISASTTDGSLAGCTLHTARALDEGAQAGARARPIEVLHPAIGGGDEALGGHVAQRLTQARGDDVGRLRRRVAEVEDPEYHRLAADRGERGEIEPRLRRFQREVRGGRALELQREPVAAGLRGAGERVRERIAEADVDARRLVQPRQRAVDRGQRVGLGVIGARLEIRLV